MEYYVTKNDLIKFLQWPRISETIVNRYMKIDVSVTDAVQSNEVKINRNNINFFC